MKKRVLIADDHTLVRAGLAMLVNELADYEVVAEVADGVETLEQAQRLKPELILLDIHMPRMSGLDCLAHLRATLPDTQVLILSMHANEEHVMRALELGAQGYLLKDATPRELGLAIQTVAQGNIWLSAAVSPQVLKQYRDRSAKNETITAVTPRQLQILKRLAEGASVKEIAYELELSIKTVETHRAQIMERLGLHDLPALVRYAIRHGIAAL